MARSYVKKIRCDEKRGFAATVGATAVVRGQLVKYSAGAIVTLADDDKQLDVYLTLTDGAIAATGCIIIPLREVDEFEIAYIGSAPTVGAAYAVEDGLTLDQANTTDKLLVVHSVDTSRTTCMAAVYQLSS